MGLCPSVCPPATDPEMRQTLISVVPGQFSSKRLLPSDKNNDKFYYIHDEENIDLEITRLDEIPFMYESNMKLLEQILLDLRKMVKKFEPSGTHESAHGQIGLSIVDTDSVLLPSETTDENPGQSQDPREEKERRPQLFRKKSSSYAHNKTGGTGKRQEIKNGNLAIEIQKAQFLSAKHLRKNKLTAPYVVVKMYLNKTNRVNSKTLHSLEERAKYETLKNESAQYPEWTEVFDHAFIDEEKISYHMIGISLYYLNDKDDTVWQVGEEQVFNVGTLMDQKVQEKEIDFKDTVNKGVFAKLRVRFQFIYDLDSVKERLIREVRARIERLYRIRGKHGLASAQRKETHYQRVARISNAGSMISQSSNHDNDDHNYFVENDENQI